VVPHLPPQVIDIEGEVDRGEMGINASVYRDWGRDYSEWWATQSCGPLGSPFKPHMSSFYFLQCFWYISFTFLFFLKHLMMI